MTALWAALLAAAVGCYVLKLAGVGLPSSVLNHPRVQHIASVLPIGMLSALVVVEILDDGGRYSVDWTTLAGVGAGALALIARQGVLVVFAVAVVVTAGLRALL